MTSVVRAGVSITHRDQLPSSSRYELLVKIASGGMATVYVGRLSSASGVSRLVAVKRAHAHLLEDPEFARMLISEAKLASRIHHPNVVAVQNVEEIEGELLLVMDYVEGASLSELMQLDEKTLPASVSVRVLLDACAGLHAAHELADDDGRPLGIVHRDVSPHNILVGADGVARLTDFGIAKSSNHTASGGRTSTGALKGKVAYMAPEYVESGTLDVRSDVFALGIVAWELLTCRRLFRGASEVDTLKLVLATKVPPPSEVAPWLGTALDAVILKALDRSPAARFASAAELGEALESAARRSELIAKHAEVASFIRMVAGAALERRRSLIRARHQGDGPNVDGHSVAPLGGREEATASAPALGRQTVTASFPVARVASLAPPLSDVATPAIPTRSRVPLKALILTGGALAVVSALVVTSRIGATPRSFDLASASGSTASQSATVPEAPAAEEARAAEVATGAPAAESGAFAAPTPPASAETPATAETAETSATEETPATADTAGRGGQGRSRPSVRPRSTPHRKPPRATIPTPYDTPPKPTTTGAIDRAPPNPYAR